MNKPSRETLWDELRQRSSLIANCRIMDTKARFEPNSSLRLNLKFSGMLKPQFPSRTLAIDAGSFI